MPLSKSYKTLVRKALEEDRVKGDLTSRFIIPARTTAQATIIAKDKGILCGIEIARFVFLCLDRHSTFKIHKKDADCFTHNDRIATIRAKTRAILGGERVALNFLSLLSGTATATRRLVDKVSRYPATILSTRKTTPTLRELEKYAVRIGGGLNHRTSLSDWVLIKDNHLRFSGCVKAGTVNPAQIKRIMKKIRAGTTGVIEVEVENISEFIHVADTSPDVIMLDNFPIKDLATAVRLRNQRYPKIKLEASGGVNEKNVEQIAATGVDFISVGNITHSPRAIDFSLEF